MEIQKDTAKTFTRKHRTALPGVLNTITPPLLTFPPGFDISFAKRLLGKKRGRNLSASTTRRLTRMQEKFSRLIKPQLTYQEVRIVRVEHDAIILDNGISLKSRKMAHSLRDARKIVAFIATVGEKTDKAINKLMEDGQMANAYVGDALGSAAVEKLADTFQNHLDNTLHPFGRTTGPRFSPGYCDWPIIEQKKLFSLVKGSVAKVTLGESSLMHPRKSISAVFGIYDQEDVPKTKNLIPCLRCAKKECIARRMEAQT